MSKMSVVRRCYNCGAILQCEDESKEGYIEPRLLEGGDETVLFCAKCWSTQRYNFAPRAQASRAITLPCSKMPRPPIR